MMSVMVPFSSDSISSTGPGIGSCWHKCSARRICCRFCQMISASFSHLGGVGLSTALAFSAPPCLAGHPPALQHVQGALGGAPVPRELLPPLPLDQLVVQDGCLLLAQQLQRLLVLLGQVLRAGVALRAAGTATRAAGTATRAAGALTTRYCCSVWASRCSQASSDAFFCCSVVSRDRRSWGPSWESWENWAGRWGAALAPASSVPQPLHPPAPHPPWMRMFSWYWMMKYS